MKKLVLTLMLILISLNVLAAQSDGSGENKSAHLVANVESDEKDFNTKFKQTEPITTKYLMWVFFVLVISIVVSVIGIYLLKIFIDKKQNMTNGKKVEILATRRLSTKLNIFVIKVDEVEYIITSTSDASSITRHDVSHDA